MFFRNKLLAAIATVIFCVAATASFAGDKPVRLAEMKMSVSLLVVQHSVLWRGEVSQRSFNKRAKAIASDISAARNAVAAKVEILITYRDPKKKSKILTVKTSAGKGLDLSNNSHFTVGSLVSMETLKVKVGDGKWSPDQLSRYRNYLTSLRRYVDADCFVMARYPYTDSTGKQISNILVNFEVGGKCRLQHKVFGSNALMFFTQKTDGNLS